MRFLIQSYSKPTKGKGTLRSLFVLLMGVGVLFIGQTLLGAAMETYQFDVIDPAAGDIGEAGYVDSRVVEGSQIAQIEWLQVTLNLTAELAGDVYAYLVHDTGRVVLLNRVGRSEGSPYGYLDGGGFQVVFQTGAGQGDIHRYQEVTGVLDDMPLSGSWEPDGRDVDPLTVVESSERTMGLDSFIGLDPNGSWDLFIADLLDGDQTGLVSWALELGGPSVMDSAAQVVAQHLFYNRSAFDQNDGATNSFDDGAIAPGVSALRNGQQASLGNISNYYLGINGVMLDTKNIPDTVSLSDFIFQRGNSNDPQTWVAGPTPIELAFREGGGSDGADRITLVWNDNNRDDVVDANEAVQGQWLQVTLLANATTGLATNYVFYFGSAIGEVGNDVGSARVSSADILLIRNNPRSFVSPATISDPYDINRDTKVNAADLLLARSHLTSFVNELKLIDLIAVPAATTLSVATNRAPQWAREGADTPALRLRSGVENEQQEGSSIGQARLNVSRSGSLNLSFRGKPSRRYSVSYTEDLKEGLWSPLDAHVREVSPGWYVASDPMKSDVRFYRFYENNEYARE